MSEENIEFSPVIYRSPHPSMKFQLEVGKDKNGEPIYDEWQFTNGVFVCDTPEKVALLDAYLEERKKRHPATLAFFQRTDRETALKQAIEHQEQQRRENAAITGPFQADHMIHRSQPTSEHRALSEDPMASEPKAAAAVATGLAALLAKTPASKVEENSVEAASQE